MRIDQGCSVLSGPGQHHAPSPPDRPYSANNKDCLLYTSRILSLNGLMNERGIDRRLLRGKGIVAMFTGTSGTGKTTAAEALAGEVGVDLYKVCLLYTSRCV